MRQLTPAQNKPSTARRPRRRARPDITATRRNGTLKYGFGLNAEQEISKDIGVFGRLDGSGKPTWYVATCTLSGVTCAGSLLRTTGPAFGPTFNSGQVQAFTAGTISVNFTDGNNATLNYTVGSVTASKTITRQLF